jgi:serine/threonine protein kinase
MDEGVASLRGWLRERCVASSRDEKVYSVLAHNTMRIFLRETASCPILSFPVSSIVDVSSIDTYCYPSFRIRLADGTTHCFRCSSRLDCSRWVCALSHSPPNEKVTIDSFEVMSVIGQGAFGKVYLARSKTEGGLYAIKVMRKVFVNSHRSASRIIAERNILMQASHPFITRLHYAFQNERSFYFVLEYVAGGDLRFHLERGTTFSREQIRLWLAEIVVALRTLHRLGVIYRDLKPENIMIDVSGHIKLGDFGLSTEQRHGTHFSLCGTREYVSPEMIREEPQTFCVDWWALGILACQLIAGELPYRHMNPQKLFQAILNRPIKLPPSLDEPAASFIRQLLVKDPTLRLGAPGTDVMAHPFFDWISWERVAKLEYEPQFKPDVTSPESVCNFDPEITREPVSEMHSDPDSLMQIPDFSFQSDPSLPGAVSCDNLAAAV